jgi:hypothetical protein
MREWPVKADPLDPVMVAFQPRRVIRFASRARGEAAPYSDLCPLVVDATPANRPAPETGDASPRTCGMQADIIARRAADVPRAGPFVGTPVLQAA